MNVSSVSDSKHLSKSTSDSTKRCSRPIEKNELPVRGLRRIEMSRICGSATAPDQKPQTGPAPKAPGPLPPARRVHERVADADRGADHEVRHDALLLEPLEAAGLVGA